METDLVKMQCIQSGYGRVPSHKYERCRICLENSQGCYLVRAALQNQVDQGETKMCLSELSINMVQDCLKQHIIPLLKEPERLEIPFDNGRIPSASKLQPIEITYDSQKTQVLPLVIYLPGPMPYKLEKAIPYKYGATMIEEGREVPLSLSSTSQISVE